MKRVYLDWGVVSNLKKPEFAEVKDFLLSRKGDLFFVYSPAHFEDGMRSNDEEKLLMDIAMLESLVDNHLLAYNIKNTNPYFMSPSEYYRCNKDRDLDRVPDFSDLLSSVENEFPELGSLLKTLLSMPAPIPKGVQSQQIINMLLPSIPESPSFYDLVQSGVSFVNNMLGDKEYYKSYRNAVRESGFSVGKNAGNWKSNEVIPNISAMMKSNGIDKSFDELVLSGFGDKGKVDDFTHFIAAYCLLDMIGYRSDKLPKSSNAMNSVNTDAEHAYYAAFCDFFITQDKHLFSKATALYQEFGISTKVISPFDAIAELGETYENNLALFLQEELQDENIEREEGGIIVYKFSKRYLGIFSHCIFSRIDDCTILEFKLDYGNYSHFIYYEEAGIMIDTVIESLGRPNDCEYEKIRQSIVSGNPNASIVWTGEDVKMILKEDQEIHRPELFVMINTNNELLKPAGRHWSE